jgi:hypothetical protein
MGGNTNHSRTCQSNISLVAASQKMKDSVSMIRTKQLYRGILIASSNASSSVLLKVFPLISFLFWCHMYDVLVYKMLWDRKNIEYQFMKYY